MRSALFLSPHLDDVAFSCAGTLAHLLDAGWRARVVTVFTGSVLNPRGFALACQTDKGLGPEVDYMSLRREEDQEFARILNVPIEHWPLLEAPHRGYESAPELFAGARADDEVWRDIAARLQVLEAPDLVFAPQGLGNHVDHLQVIRAVLETGWSNKMLWYRDTPYAIRQPDAEPSGLLPHILEERAVDIGSHLQRKIEGAGAYASQIGFQFGGAEQVASKLRDFHEREAKRAQRRGFFERFLAPPGLDLPI